MFHFRGMKMIDLPTPLVTPSWLNSHLVYEDLILLESSLTPIHETKINATPNECIPGAQLFSLEEIKDHDTDLPHMMPKTRYSSEFKNCDL